MTAFELCKDTVADAITLVELSLTEDTGSSSLAEGVDCTTDSIVPQNATASAAFVSRKSGIVSGVEVARLVAEKFAPNVELETQIADGETVEPKQTIATLSGPAHDILTIERTCLNFMCRLSGISTLTREFVDRVSGTKAQVLDTRKTTPGWRRLEKYAVACGGGTNHRMGLYDAVMLKDNHLAFFRSQVDEETNVIPKALQQSREWIKAHASTLPNGSQTILQLEVDTIAQFEISIAESNPTRPDIVLLDNMSIDQLTEAVTIRDRQAPQVLLEASGGVNLDTIAGIAATGVDRISVGALTHSAINFDIGLDWLSRG
jgi:nicotinate-nucleotide pyrophosphorylase (carboxylating)